jgi:hypothetical protein
MLSKIRGFHGGDYENAVSSGVTPCRCCKNRSFGGTCRLHHQGDSVLRLLATANVHSSPIIVTLMMEAVRSSETSVLTRATRRKIPDGGILQSHRRENLKAY